MSGEDVKRQVMSELRERLTYFRHYGYDATEVETAIAALSTCVVLTAEETHLVHMAVTTRQTSAQMERAAALLTPQERP